MRILSGRIAAKQVIRIASRGLDLANLEPKVRRIVGDVRQQGDLALRRYSERWDHLKRGEPLRISQANISEAWESIPRQTRKSLRQAAQNIRRFCEWQKPKTWLRKTAGTTLGQLVIPLESVGCYVPGGRYPLVSTLLMTVIPAQVAAVQNIRIVCPNPSTEMLAAAEMLGVNAIYRVGGAQAIAAFAYGTKTIPRVNKIVGPGNAYVTVAKKLVSFDCAIDFLAGPTEAVVLSETGTPEFIAADLVSQAEHDPQTTAIFVTTSEVLARSVAGQIDIAAKNNPIALRSVRQNGAILLADSRDQAREWANLLAPEHITIDEDDLPYIRNAGSVFIGNYSPQAAGDYASGPNHVLPTSGQARFRGGLSVLDFVKLVTVQQNSANGLRKIAKTIESLAEIEGLRAHAESIRVRYANA
jgi:histidinol dehydrogenase